MTFILKYVTDDLCGTLELTFDSYGLFTVCKIAGMLQQLESVRGGETLALPRL